MSRSLHLGCHCLSVHHPRVRRHVIFHTGTASAVHHCLSSRNFLSIRAPVLAHTAPRNTHSCLIPSHAHPNGFFTLPRSPRLFGRLLVISKFSHCCRVTGYFHSRSLHTSHRPRFARISVRASFLGRRRVVGVGRKLVGRLFGAVVSIRFRSFPHVACTRTVHSCTSSGPSLHVPLGLISITSLVGSISFGMFTNPTGSPGNHITTLHVPNNTSLDHGRVSTCAGFINVCNTHNLTCVGIGSTTGVGGNISGRSNLRSPVVGGVPSSILMDLVRHANTRDGSVVFFNTSGTDIMGSTVNTLHRGVNLSLRVAAYR